MIIEALIASNHVTIEIDGHVLRPDLIDAKLPVPLLREHAGSPIGEVYRLDRHSGKLIAVAETSETYAYQYVSPGLRLHDGRMKLLELSLVQQSKSLHTQIVNRAVSDPFRDYARCLAEGHDLTSRYFTTLQRLVRTIHDHHRQ